ncbi:hypothetical protein JDV02_003006 [Purpureocillium takamizusanense]|uniref:Uncharacterized protein n=1 Tax=Purpureocillium takamizusanense TaxID=2060973 RepID=A0A9Q8V806_9HYPO|nr:uncharacterized protein JDV02_003006 [Purpureocillium takamizusanense]UNI16580.1 hypothetical protein JDV02_003006 [Purpureocillium takamizusanense]
MTKYYIAMQASDHYWRGDKCGINGSIWNMFWDMGHRRGKRIEDKGGGLWWILYDSLADSHTAWNIATGKNADYAVEFEEANIIDECGEVVQNLPMYFG